MLTVPGMDGIRQSFPDVTDTGRFLTDYSANPRYALHTLTSRSGSHDRSSLDSISSCRMLWAPVYHGECVKFQRLFSLYTEQLEPAMILRRLQTRWEINNRGKRIGG